MRMKKLFSLLCAAAVALSAVGGLPAAAEPSTYAEGETTDITENFPFSAPTNVHVDENNVIRWDAVEGADKYVVSISVLRDSLEKIECIFFAETCYYSDDWKQNVQTMCDNQSIDFQDTDILRIRVCIPDDEGRLNNEGSASKWSVPIYLTTESYPAPTNVYVDENDVIRWDAVEGAASYQVRIENKEGNYTTFVTNTNYLSNWKPINVTDIWRIPYARNHTFTISVAAMDTSNTVGEYSEPVEFTYSMKPWKANFKYDAETGGLSWDNWTDDVSNGNLYYYLWGIPYSRDLPFSAMSIDDGYWNPALSGYSPAWVTLPLEFAYRSLQDPDTDYRGDHTLWLTSSALGSAEEWWTDKVGDYESTDTFSYSYDGCDVNPALKPPKDNLWQRGGWASDSTNYITVAWDPVDGAIGYIVHFTCKAGNWNADTYDYTSYHSLVCYWYSYNGIPDGAWCLEICSVDKNGDRSEWSEPLYFTVKDGKPVDGLEYAYLNNIDSEGNLLLTEAEGAVRYTVGVTGNGADLSFESETPVIEGFSDALKSYPAGEYTIVISTYNNIGICRWLVGSFDKQDEGFFNEENETGSAVESAPEAAEIPESDKIPAVAINPAFNLIKKGETDVFFNIGNIKIKAKEIYDEEGLKRAEEALGEEIIGNKHYNLLDLTLWEGNTDISNGYEGLVKVTIPLPTGHLDKTFHVYRYGYINGKWSYEEIPGEQTEDSYIIYLEHFSEYALVADGGETPAPEKSGFYSDGLSILNAEIGTTVTQKTEVKDGTYDVRFIRKVNADTLSGKSKATFTLTANGVTKEVSTAKYYTGLTFDDGTSAKAESGQAFLCYTVTGVPENVTVTADRVVLE